MFVSYFFPIIIRWPIPLILLHSLISTFSWIYFPFHLFLCLFNGFSLLEWWRLLPPLHHILYSLTLALSLLPLCRYWPLIVSLLKYALIFSRHFLFFSPSQQLIHLVSFLTTLWPIISSFLPIFSFKINVPSFWLRLDIRGLFKRLRDRWSLLIESTFVSTGPGYDISNSTQSAGISILGFFMSRSIKSWLLWRTSSIFELRFRLPLEWTRHSTTSLVTSLDLFIRWTFIFRFLRFKRLFSLG